MRGYKQLASAALALTLMAGSASAATILVDFETTPGADGILGTADDLAMSNENIRWIRNDLSAAGITFTQGTLFVGSLFGGNPGNHFLSSTNPVGSFSIPVFGISIESYSYWNATLYAYDANGAVLATSYVFNNTGDFKHDVLSLTTTQAIAGFAVLPDNPNYILNLDNMVLTTTAPVSEPSTYAMLAGGLALLASRARRRRA
jgi:hypothetical protein